MSLKCTTHLNDTRTARSACLDATTDANRVGPDNLRIMAARLARCTRVARARPPLSLTVPSIIVNSG